MMGRVLVGGLVAGAGAHGGHGGGGVGIMQTGDSTVTGTCTQSQGIAGGGGLSAERTDRRTRWQQRLEWWRRTRTDALRERDELLAS